MAKQLLGPPQTVSIYEVWGLMGAGWKMIRREHGDEWVLVSPKRHVLPVDPRDVEDLRAQPRVVKFHFKHAELRF